jgi:PAS domain S-box-containing protein
MNDKAKTNAELLEEISVLKKKIKKLEKTKTAYTRAEDALMESEARLIQAQAIAHLGSWEVDLTNRLMWGSEEAFRIYGIEYPGAGAAFLPLSDIQKVVHPEDRPRMDSALRELLQKDKEYDQEFRIFRISDGALRVIHSRADVYVSEKGTPLKVFGTIQDVTDRKRAEEEQRHSRQMAERLANEMAVIAEIGRIIGSTLDIDEVYDRFAAEVKKLIAFDRIVVNLNDPQKGVICTSYSSGLDVPGRRPGDIYPLSGSVNETLMRTRTGMINRPSGIEEITDQYPGLAPAFQAGMRSIIAVPLISGDVVIGGLHFHSKIAKAYTEQDLRLAERIGAQIAGAMANAQLFSEFNRAAASLRESESRFRAIFEQAAVGVAEVETETGRFLAVNRQLCEIMGRTEEDLLATTFRAITHPDDLDLHREKTELPLAGKSGYCNLEKRYLRKDGRIVWMNIASSPLSKPGETPTRNLVVVQDITERRQAEAEMRSLQERLQRAEKMEALGTLAGGVAHDLNNVLGIVVGYAELLLNEVDHSSPIKSRIQNIMTGGERAAAIVQDLLTLARRGVSSRRVVNLNKIIMDYQNLPEFETFSSYHPEVLIKTHLDPDILNISGSSVHLSKTLFNLVSNAAEAMPNGGVLTIKTANRYLDKPIRGYDEIREGDYVVLSVSDTGEGISAADLKHIFEPFYTKKVMGRSGTGLGLSVVWGTVKDHYGYINVQSEEGKGSTFTLYFPVTRQETPAESVAVSLSEYMGKGESILIVDDVQGQRDLTAEMLRNLNYIVTTAASGEEAVAYLKEHTVDLMVLDMIMEPGMDGLETYRSVLEVHPKQKAIIVSGFSETERVNAAQALGAGAYVRKPYVMEKMGLAVRKELDRNEMTAYSPAQTGFIDSR